MFYILLLLTSTQALVTNSPILMITLIIVSALLTTFMILNIFSWFSYFIFLIFVGGMMILFMYIVSLSKNESLKIKKFWLIFFLLLSGCLTNESNFKTIPDTSAIFSKLNFSTTLISIIYLFVMLMMAIKIIYFNQGPMRTSN